jgi:YVTN family beta-propeller protein
VHARLRRAILAGGSIACAVGVGVVSTASVFAGSDGVPRGGKVVASIRIPQGSGGLAVGEGAVWAMSDSASTLLRIDPKRNTVSARIKVKPNNPCPAFPQACSEAAAGQGAIWVSHPSDNTVSRIDPQTNRVLATIPVGRHPDGIAVSPGAVWVANSGGPTVNSGGPSVSRIDPAANRVVATIETGPARGCCSDFMQLTVGGGSVWVGVPNLTSVVRIDPATNAVTATIRLSVQPYGFLAADKSAVWSSGGHAAGVVARLDPRTNRLSGSFNGAETPIGLGLAFGSLWVADLDSKVIDRVNPHTARTIGRLRVGGYPVRIAVGFGSVWVRDDTGRVLRIRPQR